MNKRCVVIVLDGFGIGAMADAQVERPGDEVSSTLGSLLKDYPDLKLPTLEKLGLMNAYGQESACMHFSKNATFGKSELMHYGADTFMGHQEIMGSLPKKPIPKPFQDKIDDIKKHLEDHHHKVEVCEEEGLKYLLVDDYCTVADNIDADLGMAYNCTAPLDYMSFEEELEIGHLVRDIAKVNRVITFGGHGNTIDDILQAAQTRENKYIGIHAVKSKSYEKGYECIHLGYGVDKNVQIPTILTKNKIPVSLFGKVADVVINDQGKSVSCVDTAQVLDLTIEELKHMQYGFICTNVQETDLAGHSEDSLRYKELLEIADKKIALIINQLHKGDLLIVMADHGNDPNIGHNKHTRENVPLLIWNGQSQYQDIGLRKTLSDVGATIAECFDVESPQNGISFYEEVVTQ